MTSSLVTLAVTTAALAALAGCASDRTTAQQDTTSTTSGNTTWTAGSAPEQANITGAASGATTNANAAAATGAATAHNWTGVVIAVDPILRQDAAAMGVGMAGAAAAGGTMSNQGSPNDKVYRITIRADDGTTQVVILDSIPTYKSGDRVRYRDGAIQRE